MGGYMSYKENTEDIYAKETSCFSCCYTEKKTGKMDITKPREAIY